MQPLELCGENLPEEQEQMVSNTSLLKITFITAGRAVGAKGFRAIWTQVYDGTFYLGL